MALLAPDYLAVVDGVMVSTAGGSPAWTVRPKASNYNRGNGPGGYYGAGSGHTQWPGGYSKRRYWFAKRPRGG